VAKTRVIDCPECNSKIRLSVRNNGEVTVLDSEESEALEEIPKL